MPERSRSGRSTASTSATARGRDGGRDGAAGAGAHVRPAPAGRARQPGRAADDARAPAGAAPRAGRRRDGRGRVHARDGAARAGGVRRRAPRPGARWSSRARTSASARKRRGDLELLERLGLEVRVGAAARGRVSSSQIRHGSTRRRARRRRACWAGRPSSTASSCPATARRHARLPDREPRARPAPARAALRHLRGAAAVRTAGYRAAISIGTNPHYGGEERRIEPYLLDFEGDLYGQRLVVELWERLRDERAFASEQELVDQIAPRRRADA